MSLSLREALIAASQQLGNWANVEAFLDALDDVGDFDWLDVIQSDDNAIKRYKLTRIRRDLKQLKDETDFPVFGSVLKRDRDTGAEERVYKQEALFELDDYRQITAYYVDRANADAFMARAYRERALTRFGVELQLEFDLGAVTA